MNHTTELVWVNRATLDPGLQIQEHSHICYQLYYILQGDPVFVINAKELRAHPNTFFYIPPNTPHRMLPLSAEKLLAYDLKFVNCEPVQAIQQSSKIPHHQWGCPFSKEVCVQC